MVASVMLMMPAERMVSKAASGRTASTEPTLAHESFVSYTGGL